MEIKATTKFARISSKKAQPMVAALRGEKAADALLNLKYHPSKTAVLLYKLIKSAISNATNNYNLKEDNLRIKTLTVDNGPTMKRYWFRSHGAADPLLKRSSHFTVTLEEIKPSLVKKPVASSKPVSTETPISPVAPIITSAAPAVPIGTKARPNKLAQSLKKVLTRRTTNK